MQNWKTNPGATIFNRTRQYLAHADNAVVLGHAMRHTAEIEEDTTKIASEIGLTITASKTKYTK
jgi:hypothetical protein